MSKRHHAAGLCWRRADTIHMVSDRCQEIIAARPRHNFSAPFVTALNDRRRLYVMHLVRGEMNAREAAKAAGYQGKSPEKGLKASRGVRDAIAEERCRR